MQYQFIKYPAIINVSSAGGGTIVLSGKLAWSIACWYQPMVNKMTTTGVSTANLMIFLNVNMLRAGRKRPSIWF